MISVSFVAIVVLKEAEFLFWFGNLRKTPQIFL